MHIVPPPTNSLVLIYVDMASLQSGLDWLKITTKGYSVTHSLSQQLVLDIDITREYLLAAPFP